MKKIFAVILLLLICASCCFAESFDEGFEGYILTHVKKEMSPNWHIEALKAQAVLARTFEMKAGHGDMTAAADFSAAAKPEQAVAETAGQVLKCNGELASVFYHADSGGATSTAEYVWGGKNLPYLAVKKDVFATQSPNQLWQKSITKADFEALLLSNGISVGVPVSFSNIVRDESGRIKSLDITGSLGSANISGGKLRSIAGLKSTLVNFGDTAPAYSLSQVLPPAAQNRAAGRLEYSYLPMSNIKKKKLDINKMPADKQDRLTWFADCGIISLDQLMRMLAHPENIDAQIAFCMKRLSTVTGKSFDNAAQEANKPAESPALETRPQNIGQTSEYAAEYKLDDLIVFTGRGWGHGVGLPQWQAKAMAENGWTYAQILEYYFPGLTLEHY